CQEIARISPDELLTGPLHLLGDLVHYSALMACPRNNLGTRINRRQILHPTDRGESPETRSVPDKRCYVWIKHLSTCWSIDLLHHRFFDISAQELFVGIKSLREFFWGGFLVG